MTFSLGEGIIHEYYTVALAPALGALVGIGGVTLWRRRGNWFARIGLAGVIALTGWWTVQLLARTPDFNAWLQPLVVVGSIIGVVGVLAADHIGRTGRAVALSAAVVAGLIAPAAASIATAARAPHRGAADGGTVGRWRLRRPRPPRRLPAGAGNRGTAASRGGGTRRPAGNAPAGGASPAEAVGASVASSARAPRAPS